MDFLKQLLADWPNPPAIHRGAPFWSWNASMDTARLCRAIDEMAAAGMGGFFIHSREGLSTPYMGEEWFACVEACVERARELDLKAYLYDEDRWPSGAGGGFATREHPEFRTHGLLAAKAGDSGGEELASFAVDTDEQGRLRSYTPLHDEASDGRVITFYDCVGGDNNWFNRGAYLDTMSPDAVDEFIHVSYQAYADRFVDDFGSLVPAIFTDEPNYGATRDYVSAPANPLIYLPWTSDLPRHFISRRGYDLRDHLPELLFPLTSGEFSTVRHDYYRTITELFVENFTARIGKWCRRHQIALTGHVLQEETLLTQTRVVGTTMPHYEHMDWPGIDALCDQTSQLSSARQVASVAAQLGKQRVLSEMYGCTGWDWPLEGHKFIGDWHYACGVNFRCHHLTHYSLAGLAKRDYPASIFLHSPWWPYYRVVEDYFARLTAALTPGQPVRDVLMIHPVESAWGLVHQDQEPSPLLQQIDDAFQQIIRDLTGEHYDFDLGDESLLVRHGSVSKGGELVVGKMNYRLVVVPPCITLRKSTLALLEEFAAAGGALVFVGRTPDHIDAKPCTVALPDGAHRVEEVGQLPAALEALLARRVSIRGEAGEARGVWAMLKRVDGGQMLFAQSQDRDRPRRVRVSVAGEAPVVLWDAVSGTRYQLPHTSAEGRVEFELTMQPTGSALLSLGLAVSDAVMLPDPVVTDSRDLPGPYDVELTEPNTFPLDYCRYTLGDDDWSEPLPSLAAEARIRAHFQLPARMGYICQPWYLYKSGLIDTAPRGRCRLERSFHVTVLPARCLLAVERPQDFAITVNGQPIGEPSGWWVDEDIHTIDITPLLREGENTVVQECDYRADMELESLYLVGQFGVAPREGSARQPGEMTLVAPPRELHCGSWGGQGLDFYGAAVRYRLRIDKPDEGRVRLALPEVSCTAAAIHVGGQTFPLPWAPFEADITDALDDGANEVIVEVIGGRKNILGPLHTPWTLGTGPGSFEPHNPNWTREYQLTDHGLMVPPRVEILR